MAFVKCVTCGGVFEPVLPDGLQYFHVCPPLSRAELHAAYDKGTLPLTERQARALATAIAADRTRPIDVTTPLAFDVTLESFIVDRPNARDENIDLAKVEAALDARGARKPGTTAETVMKKPGAGVTPL